MRYQITAQGDYIRGVIGDGADQAEFAAFYSALKAHSASGGFDRALVVVLPESEAPGAERLALYAGAGFMRGFKLALVCATWTLYQGCNKAERAAKLAAINVRAFLQEMEAIAWLKAEN